MKKETKYFKGNNPYAVYLENSKIKLILEEKKLIKSKSNYPKNAIDVIRVMCQIEGEATETSINIIKQLDHSYYGLKYDQNYIFNMITKNGIYYKMYIHDPKNPKFTTPSRFFKDVSKLIQSDLKVGWFQERWSVGWDRDLNRCILSKRKIHMGKIIDKEISQNKLFMGIVKNIGIPSIKRLNAYNPLQAIKLLKSDKIDVLVIGNTMVCKKEETLNAIHK